MSARWALSTRSHATSAARHLDPLAERREELAPVLHRVAVRLSWLHAVEPLCHFREDTHRVRREPSQLRLISRVLLPQGAHQGSNQTVRTCAALRGDQLGDPTTATHAQRELPQQRGLPYASLPSNAGQRRAHHAGLPEPDQLPQLSVAPQESRRFEIGRRFEARGGPEAGRALPQATADDGGILWASRDLRAHQITDQLGDLRRRVDQ